MFRKFAVLAFAVAVPGTAGAIEWGEAPSGTVDVFAVPRVAFKSGEVPAPLDEERTYGDGAGFRSTFRVFQWVGVLAEYQYTAVKETTLGPSSSRASGRVDEFRIGPGWLHRSGSGFFIEYVQQHVTGSTIDGFGGRGRVAFRPIEPAHAYSEIGYSSLKPTNGDSVKLTDLHFALGGAVPVAGNWDLFAEYRRTRQTNDVDDRIDTQEDFRLGVRANLPY